MCALTNVTRTNMLRLGRPSWRLTDRDGIEIQAFSIFCEKLLGYPYATQKRYAEVVSQFIDYLIAAGVFGVATTPRHLNSVIEAYPTFLSEGSASVKKRLARTVKEFPQDEWLLRAATSLERKPLKPSSFSNTLAPINKFLYLSQTLAIEAFQIARLAGVENNENFVPLISALEGIRTLTEREKRNLRYNSVLGSAIRFNAEGIRRPARLTAPARVQQEDRIRFDFPIQCVPALAAAATSKRDRALWLFLSGAGPRTSEALNVQWSDIVPEAQEVYILDPSFRRLGGDLTKIEKIRFKGRTVSWTYLIPQFRPLFFEALGDYIRDEYLPSPDPADAAFVFQYVEPSLRGIPYVNVSTASLNANFHAACQRIAPSFPAKIQRRLNECTLHSLRHMYGVYMLNDFPNPETGRQGLELAEVQILLGQKDIRSTQKYARRDHHKLQQSLIKADLRLFGTATEGNSLPDPSSRKDHV